MMQSASMPIERNAIAAISLRVMSSPIRVVAGGQSPRRFRYARGAGWHVTPMAAHNSAGTGCDAHRPRYVCAMAAPTLPFSSATLRHQRRAMFRFANVNLSWMYPTVPDNFMARNRSISDCVATAMTGAAIGAATTTGAAAGTDLAAGRAGLAADLERLAMV